MDNLPNSEVSAGRQRIISGIGSPLGFFVLALLIVESFLGSIVCVSNLPNDTRAVALWVGIGLFALVLFIVLILVIWFPKNLVFTENSHIRLALYGNKDNPRTDLTIDAIPLSRPPQIENSQQLIAAQEKHRDN